MQASQLLEHILSILWLSPLSIEDRQNALDTLFYISKAFKHAFTKIMFKDPYFYKRSSYNWFLDFAVTGKQCILGNGALAKERCTSMSFLCEEGKSRKYPRFDGVPYIKRDQLDGVFPKLCRVNVEYLNCAFWEPTTEWWIFLIPVTVHTLGIYYTTDNTRESYKKKEPRVTSFGAGPYLHYTRVPTYVKTLFVEKDRKSKLTRENLYQLAAIFPNLEYLEWNGEEVPLANGPIDEDMWERLRALPDCGAGRERGVKRFKVNVSRHLVKGGETVFVDTLRTLIKEEPEVFAMEMARLAGEGRLPKFVAALKKMEKDGVFERFVELP